MEVVPASVGRISRAWDEQHLDLRAASEQIAGAGAGGFSAEVRSSASRFLRTWERHTEQVAEQCETQADDLRVTIRDYLDTDAQISEGYFRLAGYLTERR